MERKAGSMVSKVSKLDRDTQEVNAHTCAQTNMGRLCSEDETSHFSMDGSMIPMEKLPGKRWEGNTESTSEDTNMKYHAKARRRTVD